MQLIEEYLKRHSLTGVPFSSYFPQPSETDNFFFLRSRREGQVHWTILVSKWRTGFQVPGTYAIRHLRPSYASQGEFNQMGKTIFLLWDQYEDFMISWVKAIPKKDCIFDREEITLTAWEMFVYTYNTIDFSKFCCCENFISSLDDSVPTKTRIRGYLSSIQKLKIEYPKIYKSWNKTITLYQENYLYWIKNLIDFYGQ